jgi:hypothetical protein
MASDVKSIDIEVRWVVVKEENGSPYSFPNRLSPFIRKNYCHPVIYRWSVSSSEAVQSEAVYVGEAEDLSVRIQRVLTPGETEKRGGQTNERLRKKFDEGLAKGNKISLETADFEDFEFNRVCLSKQQLHNRFHRCALENLLILVEVAAGREVLNHLPTFENKATRMLSKVYPNVPRGEIHRKMKEFFNHMQNKKNG